MEKTDGLTLKEVESYAKGYCHLPSNFSEDGDYIFVRISDLQGGFTQGTDAVDAVKMAEDLIGKLLEDETSYPKPSDPQDIDLAEGESLVYISVDLAAFRIKYSKTVRRNVTITGNK